MRSRPGGRACCSARPLTQGRHRALQVCRGQVPSCRTPGGVGHGGAAQRKPCDRRGHLQLRRRATQRLVSRSDLADTGAGEQRHVRPVVQHTHRRPGLRATTGRQRSRLRRHRGELDLRHRRGQRRCSLVAQRGHAVEPAGRGLRRPDAGGGHHRHARHRRPDRHRLLRGQDVHRRPRHGGALADACRRRHHRHRSRRSRSTSGRACC